MSRCIGQAENIAAAIAKSRERNVKNWAHNDTERKDAGLLLMNRVHANGHLVTLLEGLPLNAVGNHKQQKALALKVPFTLLFSLQSYVNCIKSPQSAIASLLHDTECPVSNAMRDLDVGESVGSCNLYTFIGKLGFTRRILASAWVRS